MSNGFVFLLRICICTFPVLVGHVTDLYWVTSRGIGNNQRHVIGDPFLVLWEVPDYLPEVKALLLGVGQLVYQYFCSYYVLALVHFLLTLGTECVPLDFLVRIGEPIYLFFSRGFSSELFSEISFRQGIDQVTFYWL